MPVFPVKTKDRVFRKNPSRNLTRRAQRSTVVAEAVRCSGVALEVAEHPVGLGAHEVVDIHMDGHASCVAAATGADAIRPRGRSPKRAPVAW